MYVYIYILSHAGCIHTRANSVGKKLIITTCKHRFTLYS